MLVFAVVLAAAIVSIAYLPELLEFVGIVMVFALLLAVEAPIVLAVLLIFAIIGLVPLTIARCLRTRPPSAAERQAEYARRAALDEAERRRELAELRYQANCRGRRDALPWQFADRQCRALFGLSAHGTQPW